MQMVLVTFVLVLAIVLGGYWFFVVRLEESSERDLRRRLKVNKPKGSIVRDLLRPDQRLSQVSVLDKVLKRISFVVAPINTQIQHAGMNTTVGVIVLSSVLIGSVVTAALYFLTQLAAIALIVGAMASTAPFLVVRFKAARRQRQFEEQFPEALDLIGRALRAGHAFTTGLGMVADEIPDPVGGEFRLIHDRQNYGMPLAEALKDFGARVPLLDARFFVTAVLTQRESGGNLAEVLDNLANLIRERFKVKRQVRTVSAHGRITGWVLSFLAPTLAAVLVLIAPAHMKLMIEDPLGVQMVIGAMVLQIIGVIAIRRIINIEV
jgi:tight adherence protein B